MVDLFCLLDFGPSKAVVAVAEPEPTVPPAPTAAVIDLTADLVLTGSTAVATATASAATATASVATACHALVLLDTWAEGAAATAVAGGGKELGGDAADSAGGASAAGIADVDTEGFRMLAAVTGDSGCCAITVGATSGSKSSEVAAAPVVNADAVRAADTDAGAGNDDGDGSSVVTGDCVVSGAAADCADATASACAASYGSRACATAAADGMDATGTAIGRHP
jgi:hypothetical protein